MNIDKYDLFAVIESLLFISDRPITVDDVVSVLEKQREQDELDAEEVTSEAAPVAEGVAKSTADGVEAPMPEEPLTVEGAQAHLVRQEVEKLVDQAFHTLELAYADPTRTVGRGFEMAKVAGGWQLRTHRETSSFLRHHLQVKPTRLSRAQLETMAIVAYRQPATRAEIEQIRGVDCGAALKILLERRLVRILGKKEEVGRPLLYGTTKEFLEFFKLNSLVELPSLREFQELSDDSKKKLEDELEEIPPLNIKELAEEAPRMSIDDTGTLGELDAALAEAKATTARVAEIAGLKQAEEEPLAPPGETPAP